VIVRSIKVEAWRCFIEGVEVGPFDEGLNVIHAPNGGGKSTLFEALLRSLLDSHRVTGRDVEAIRPWGRALSPKAVIAFAHGGTEYRITKQFLEGADSVLERKENGRFRRLAEGVAADDQTRSILTQNPPGRGLARPENWGLAQVLWAPQGNLELKGLSGDVVTDIRAMLGVQVSGPGAGAVEDKIEGIYLEFFTPRGKLRSGKDAPRLVQLKEALEEAGNKLRTAQEAQLAFEEAAQKVENLRAQRAQARRNAEEFTKALSEARSRAEVYKTLILKQEQYREKANSAEAQYKELKQRIDLIKSGEDKLKGARELLAQLEETLPLKTREVKQHKKETAKRKAALEDARKGRLAVEKADQKANAARRFVDSTRALSELDKRIRRIKQAQKTLVKRKSERDEHIAPDTKVLRAVRTAIAEADEARVLIDAALTNLEVVPEKDGSLEVLAGEQTGEQRLVAGSPTQVKGSPEVVVDLAGVARLRAWGPEGSIEQHRRKLARAEQKVAELTAAYGTADVDELEGLREKAQALDKKVAETETQLDVLLSGESLESLTEDRAKLETELRKLEKIYPEWKDSPPDNEALKSTAEKVKRAFIVRVEGAEVDWMKAQTALTAAQGQTDTLNRQAKDIKERISSLERELTGLKDDGKRPQERKADLEKLAMEWEAAKGRLGEVEGELADYEENPLASVAKLERQLKAAESEATKALEKEKSEEGKLEHLSAEGPYTALALAEEQVAELEREIQGEELRVNAIRLLRDTVVACRTEAVAAVAAPVQSAATRMFHRIAGRRLGSIEMDDGFGPASVRPETVGISVTVDNLSGGEKEQLYLVTRLALADLLSKDEHQLVVLDDVLTATDAGRLARVMTILEEAAQRLQILILTCHPERYGGLEQAHFFDLEAMQRTGIGL